VIKLTWNYLCIKWFSFQPITIEYSWYKYNYEIKMLSIDIMLENNLKDAQRDFNRLIITVKKYQKQISL